jgi:hypothetical protein
MGLKYLGRGMKIAREGQRVWFAVVAAALV